MPPAHTPDFLADLDARGLIHDSTDVQALADRLDQGPITLYCGFDPTADSLHIGSLVPLLLLRRFQDAGHRPLALSGGATGMIGDPGGRSEERALLDQATLAANLDGIRPQLARLLDFDEGPTQAMLVDNVDWTAELSTIDFLRDVGKHLTVNYMLAKESVKARVESEHGISYTEFSYMLLQANDFCVLAERENCELQVGGSDQWGNITAGIDLTRRRLGKAVHGLTAPLLTRADGQKFGKSQGGNVWLDAAKTSPYQLFQYFMNVDDADVERFLLQLTLLRIEECAAIAAEHGKAPERRHGQRRLAEEVTSIVHGPEAVAPVEEATALLFGGSVADAGPEAFALLAAEVPTTQIARADLADGHDAIDLLAASLESSKGQVRKNLSGHYVNGVALDAPRPISEDDLLHDRYLLLRRGKATHHLVVVDS